MNYDLEKVEYQHDFVLRVTFKDGTSGSVDFTQDINKVKPYQLLSDINLFKNAYVDPELHTLAWTEDLDYDPVILYYRANHLPFPDDWGIVA